MTKEETVKIMAMLGAFYSGGKNDPKMQATAWHLVLGKYDYRIAQQAVLHFAENDTREYATFPTVGTIVAEIRKEGVREYKPISEVLYGVSYGKGYDQLSDDAKRLISKDMYDEWMKIDAEVFSENMGKFNEVLRTAQQRLLEVSDE